jgi:hypothetical protein
MELTKEEREVLSRGFQGPRPGSNAFPLLELRKGDVKISGERLDAMIREKVLEGWPRADPHSVIKGGDAGPYGEIPDVELIYNYRLAAVFQ